MPAMSRVPSSLPVETILPELSAALAAHGSAVLVAPPGSGKTTRVPLALLDAPWLDGQGIVLLEPRRLAATNAARYMAGLLGEAAGGTVGYTIRFERCGSKQTRLEVVTEGILTRRLQADPELAGVGLVILDEFHERSLNADLALALCRDAQRGLRPELRLLVMSATLAAEPVAALLGGAPVIRCSGRSYPVTVDYLPRDPEGQLVDTVRAGVHRALRETPGDLLVFLPGAGEIARCARELGSPDGIDIRPLYGDLPFGDQERALLPGARRRVVLATNIAETSLTIEGVGTVVDSGFERRPRFDAVAGTTRLELARISKASAEQRAGRAGRLGPGVCYRLWSEGTHGALLPASPPEIRQADLAPLALDLARWGVADANDLAWLDPPPAGALHGARELLHLLGVLDRQRLTALGGEVAGLPLHPRLGVLLLAARDHGQLPLGCDLVALLGERDLCAADWRPLHPSPSDVRERLEMLRRGRGEPGRLAAVRRAAAFWRKRFEAGADTDLPEAATVNRLLAVAFPDRIGVRRDPGGERYLLANGRGARLGARSAVPRPEFLVAAELRGTPGGEAEIVLAGSLARADLEERFAGQLGWRREVAWDEAAGRVTGREVRAIGAVVVQERPAAVTRRRGAAAAAGPAAPRGAGRPGVAGGGRCSSGRGWPFCTGRCPAEGWPDVSDAALLATLDEWLAPWLGAVRSRSDLARLDLLAILQGWLGGRGRELERLAPERLDGAERVAHAPRLCRRRDPGAGGQAAGAVRSGRHAAHRRRPGGGADPPALAGRPAAGGDPGPAQLLEYGLSGGEKGDERALPETPLAGRPVERPGDAADQAALVYRRGAIHCALARTDVCPGAMKSRPYGLEPFSWEKITDKSRCSPVICRYSSNFWHGSFPCVIWPVECRGKACLAQGDACVAPTQIEATMKSGIAQCV